MSKVFLAIVLLLVAVGSGPVLAEPVPMDPAAVMGPNACGKDCHKKEMAIWMKSKHQVSGRALLTDKKAQEIVDKLGETGGMKSSRLCQTCHFTVQQAEQKLQLAAGVSCESCHGPSRDWIKTHGDYGGTGVLREQETPAHRQQRLAQADSAGLVRPAALHTLARKCFDCHLGVSEKLVNVGGHAPGSLIELVSWTQGQVGTEAPIRHNVLFSEDNRYSPSERRRVMYILSLALELEYSLRGVAQATGKGLFGVRMAKQAKMVAGRLKQIDGVVVIPEVKAILEEAGKVKLKLGEGAELNAAAERIAAQAKAFAGRENGQNLAALDGLIPWAAPGQ
ncbi:MAG: cytochrome C554 [Magnetococcales bacterium]|nr:cytochrome C554 [Magnetococcales bacterium]